MSLFACQLDPTRREGTSTVLRCEARPDGHYELLLDDGLLYPEGGGQPPDHGTVGGVRVVDVQTDPQGLRCLALGPVAPGPAAVEVDWPRRFDHTQQHSAQHLVTAVAQDRLRLATVGFHLGEEDTTIDVDGPLSEAGMARLQAWVNEEIRGDRAVSWRLVSLDEYQALDIRSRGLPAGHEGPVRIVEIAGLDHNTCGGTHVSRLGELQLVHLSRVERHKGGARLHLVAGGRALAALDAARDRDRALSERLTCPPAEFQPSVDRLLQGARDQARALKERDSELASLLGQNLVLSGGEAVRHLHRAEADMALLTQVGNAAQAAQPQARLVLTGGGTEGVFLVLGPEDWVARAGPALALALEGRGGGRGGRYQGKAAHVERAAMAVTDLPTNLP